MNVQIGVMGSAGGKISPAELLLARRLGRRIAEVGCTIVTGACPGLPHAAVLGAHEAGGISLGISPALSREEHVNVYASPLQPYTTMVFTGSGLMGRETHNIHSSDFVIFAGGRSGTLGEFCIAYDEGKLMGVLLNSGGISNDLPNIAKLVQKDTGSILMTSDNPEELVDRLLDVHTKRAIPSALAFNRNAEFQIRRPAVTQETRG
ncbi:MAG TPA: hypothetical protein VGF86_10255 [Candidatus Tumulicola sp.]|jgi:hypothetical protein